MNLRHNSERRAPLIYQGDGTYSNPHRALDQSPVLSAEQAEDEAAVTLTRPRAGLYAQDALAPADQRHEEKITERDRNMANIKIVRRRDAPSPSRETHPRKKNTRKERAATADSVTRATYAERATRPIMENDDAPKIPRGKLAAFPSREHGGHDTTERAGRHDILRLVDERCDTDIAKRRISFQRIDSIYAGKFFPKEMKSKEQQWYTELKKRLTSTSEDPKISFHELWPSLRQTIIDEIREEASGIYKSDYEPVLILLSFEEEMLVSILQENMAVWNHDSEIPEQLLELKRQHPDLPIDPDTPQPQELVKAFHFLKQRHLPGSLLGEWQFPLLAIKVPIALPPKVVAPVSRTFIDLETPRPTIQATLTPRPEWSPITPAYEANSAKEASDPRQPKQRAAGTRDLPVQEIPVGLAEMYCAGQDIDDQRHDLRGRTKEGNGDLDIPLFHHYLPEQCIRPEQLIKAPYHHKADQLDLNDRTTKDSRIVSRKASKPKHSGPVMGQFSVPSVYTALPKKKGPPRPTPQMNTHPSQLSQRNLQSGDKLDGRALSRLSGPDALLENNATISVNAEKDRPKSRPPPPQEQAKKKETMAPFAGLEQQQQQRPTHPPGLSQLQQPPQHSSMPHNGDRRTLTTPRAPTPHNLKQPNTLRPVNLRSQQTFQNEAKPPRERRSSSNPSYYAQSGPTSNGVPNSAVARPNTPQQLLTTRNGHMPQIWNMNLDPNGQNHAQSLPEQSSPMPRSQTLTPNYVRMPQQQWLHRGLHNVGLRSPSQHSRPTLPATTQPQEVIPVSTRETSSPFSHESRGQQRHPQGLRSPRQQPLYLQRTAGIDRHQSPQELAAPTMDSMSNLSSNSSQSEPRVRQQSPYQQAFRPTETLVATASPWNTVAPAVSPPNKRNINQNSSAQVLWNSIDATGQTNSLLPLNSRNLIDSALRSPSPPSVYSDRFSNIRAPYFFKPGFSTATQNLPQQSQHNVYSGPPPAQHTIPPRQRTCSHCIPMDPRLLLESQGQSTQQSRAVSNADVFSGGARKVPSIISVGSVQEVDRLRQLNPRKRGARQSFQEDERLVSSDTKRART